jgi:hypothetical protein
MKRASPTVAIMLVFRYFWTLIAVLICEPRAELSLEILSDFAHCLRNQSPAELPAQLLKLLVLIWIDERLQLFVKRNTDLPQPLDLA